MISILRKTLPKSLQFSCCCKKSSISEILKDMAARKRGLFVPDTPRHIKIKRSREEVGLEMRCSPLISILGVSNGFSNTPKSIVIRTDIQHYLIGCGEGTQRILMELSTKFLKIGHVFVTKKSWHQTGGIIGLAISLDTGGSDELTLHAPFDLKEYMESMRTLQAFQILRLKLHEYSKTDTFEDDSFTVKQYVFPNDDLSVEETRNRFALLNLSALDILGGSLSNHDSRHHCFYIFDTKPLPPKLSAEKCTLFRVPMNNLRARLKNGEDVVLDDGTVVHPSDVIDSTYANERILILDCPEDACEKSLNYLWSIIHENLPTIVVHFSDSVVLREEKYQEFMRTRLNICHHIILDEKLENIESTSIYNMQLTLHRINNTFFPLFPFQEKIIQRLKNKNEGQSSELEKNLYWEDASSGRIYNIFTGMHFDVRKKIMNAEQTFSVLGKKSLDEIEVKVQEDKFEVYPALVFLGTGSACPSTLRNVSCILLNISPSSSLLLDCGEGSLIQMTRIFGCAKVDDILRNLKCIFISHMHPDHHGGIFGLLLARHSAFQKTFSVSSLLDDLIIIRNKEAVMNRFNSSSSKVLRDMDIVEFIPVPVDHIFDSHALVFTHKDKWKIVFSGDCRPSDTLIDIGKGADVLIHEATLEDEMGDDAKFLKHSTFSEAMTVGRDMCAKSTILWHFSQRYSKIPLLMNTCRFDRVAISFDNMKVPLPEIDVLSSLLGPLRETFASEFELMEQKRLRYLMRNVRESDVGSRRNSTSTNNSSNSTSPSSSSCAKKESNFKANGFICEKNC